MPTYVLSKVKRTGSGQKVGDLSDQEKPATELTTLAADDQVPISETSESGAWKYLKLSTLKTWIANGLQIPWGNVTEKPAFPTVREVTRDEHRRLSPPDANTFYVIER